MNDPSDSSSASPSTDSTGDTEPPQRLVVDIVVNDGDWSAFAPLEETVLAACRAVERAGAIGPHEVEACIAFTSDAEVRALNRTYRGKDKATNVLSFPAPHPIAGDGAAARMLGDIVLAAETVTREAAELAIPPGHHLQHLVIHGLLHLLGHDHEDDREAEAMERLETSLLASIGVSDPYQAAPDAAERAAVAGAVRA